MTYKNDNEVVVVNALSWSPYRHLAALDPKACRMQVSDVLEALATTSDARLGDTMCK